MYIRNYDTFPYWLVDTFFSGFLFAGLLLTFFCILAKAFQLFQDNSAALSGLVSPIKFYLMTKKQIHVFKNLISHHYLFIKFENPNSKCYSIIFLKYQQLFLDPQFIMNYYQKYHPIYLIL